MPSLAQKLLMFSGGSPAIEVTPSSWDFGSTPVGTPVSKEFTILNSGTATLVITLPITIVGAEASAFTVTAQPSSTSLAAGASTTFTVQADADVVDVFNADISIVNNSSENPKLIAITAEIISLAQAYDNRVLAASPLQYLKFLETSGLTAADASGNGRTGAYNGVTLNQVASPFGDGNAAQWDGVNDNLNAYSASLSAAWDWDEGTIILFAKPRVSTVWTDGNIHYFCRFRSDGAATDEISIRKSATNNQLILLRIAGATTQTITVTLGAGGAPSAPTDWFTLTLDWSLSGNYLRAYLNGVQIGTTQTGLVAHSINGLNSGEAHVGSANTFAPWDGALMRWQPYAGQSNAARLALGVYP